MMNDWWNDPPEVEEPPECPTCHDGFGEIITVYASDGDSGEMFRCDACGHCWAMPRYEEPDPGPDDFDGPELDWDALQPDPPEHCPHGKPWGECGDCDHEGDLAYDAAREARVFGRR